MLHSSAVLYSALMQCGTEQRNTPAPHSVGYESQAISEFAGWVTVHFMPSALVIAALDKGHDGLFFKFAQTPLA